MPDPTMARGAYVLRDQRIVYVNLAKNACTSIKWMLAEIGGEDLESFRTSERAEVSARMTIHDRDLWRQAVRPKDLTESELSAISPSNGWFVFAVVRDPRVRVWSAWQSKFLQRDPIYMRMYAGESWLPRLPRRADDVIEDFGTFVQWLGQNRGHRLLRDPHFRLQAPHLRQRVEYSKIYDISEMGQLTADLSDHLAEHGRHTTLSLGRENDTALSLRGDVFDGGTREILELIYADDIAEFGSAWDFDRTTQKFPEWTPDAFRDIATRATMGERIGYLSRRARRLAEDTQRLAAENEELREQRLALKKRNAGLRKRLAETSMRVEPRRPSLRTRLYRAFLHARQRASKRRRTST